MVERLQLSPQCCCPDCTELAAEEADCRDGAAPPDYLEMDLSIEGFLNSANCTNTYQGGQCAEGVTGSDCLIANINGSYVLPWDAAYGGGRFTLAVGEECSVLNGLSPPDPDRAGIRVSYS